MHFIDLVSEDEGLALAALKRQIQCPRIELAGHFAVI
jgi:hypothetical protein